MGVKEIALKECLSAFLMLIAKRCVNLRWKALEAVGNQFFHIVGPQDVCGKLLENVSDLLLD